jgi:hypothetical protein
MPINLGSRQAKNPLIRIMALFLTILCAITLHDVGEPRTFSISVVRGLVLSFLLNGPLWIYSFEPVRIKMKYFLALLILISGIGVFLICPYGWTMAALLLLLHIWFAFDLVTAGNDMSLSAHNPNLWHNVEKGRGDGRK